MRHVGARTQNCPLFLNAGVFWPLYGVKRNDVFRGRKRTFYLTLMSGVLESDNAFWHDRHVFSEKCCIGEVIYGPIGTCGPRVQRDFELVIPHSGELTAEVDGQEHRLQIGRVGLFLPGHREFYQFSQTHHSWCTVHPSLMPLEMRRALASSPVDLTYTEFMARLLATGLSFRSVRDRNDRRLVDYMALSLFAEYLAAAEDRWALKPRDVIVVTAARFLAEHFLEADCLQRMHEVVEVSRKTLIEKFRRDFKTPFISPSVSNSFRVFLPQSFVLRPGGSNTVGDGRPHIEEPPTS